MLDFDEDAPYLKAVPVFDEQAMRSVLGCARGKLGMTTEEWLNETRGPVELPDLEKLRIAVICKQREGANLEAYLAQFA